MALGREVHLPDHRFQYGAEQTGALRQSFVIDHDWTLRQHLQRGRYRRNAHGRSTLKRPPAAPAACPVDADMSHVLVDLATAVTPDLVEAAARLLPQLSKSSPPPTAAQLRVIVHSEATDL